jgi:hypothetical protein
MRAHQLWRRAATDSRSTSSFPNATQLCFGAAVANDRFAPVTTLQQLAALGFPYPLRRKIRLPWRNAQACDEVASDLPGILVVNETIVVI